MNLQVCIIISSLTNKVINRVGEMDIFTEFAAWLCIASASYSINYMITLWGRRLFTFVSEKKAEKQVGGKGSKEDFDCTLLLRLCHVRYLLSWIRSAPFICLFFALVTNAAIDLCYLYSTPLLHRSGLRREITSVLYCFAAPLISGIGVLVLLQTLWSIFSMWLTVFLLQQGAT